MKSSSEARNHIFPDYWTPDKILEFLQENQVYEVETEIGTLEFDLMLSNGFYNSASFDRIDDSIGYEIDNIEIRPFFLNCRFKLTTEMLEEVVILREVFQDEIELKEIAININNWKLSSKNFFIKWPVI